MCTFKEPVLTISPSVSIIEFTVDSSSIRAIQVIIKGI